MKPVIVFENVHYTYPGDELESLCGIDLAIEQGSFVAVLGHNGSGKSTLAKHMNAILVPDAGRVTVCGFDTAEEANLLEVRRRVGMVFQNPDNQIVANVVEASVLSNAPSATYSYYHAHIKPKKNPAPEQKECWVCKVCGYVYEGAEMPDDFTCPLCKHGKEDFEHVVPDLKPKQKGFVCKICGHFEPCDGELPEDYTCPLCKHPREDFERAEQ